MSNDLYQMSLDSSISFGGSAEYVNILRVPGGWIYTTACETGTGGYSQSSCFVPFNNEFMGIK